MYIKLIQVVSLLFLCSCGTIKTGRLYSKETSKVLINNKNTEINITDQRKIKAGEKPIDIPFISTPDMSIIHERKFNDDELIAIFKNEIKLGDSVSEDLIVNVNILKSTQKFYATFYKEFEEVIAELNITINQDKIKCIVSEEVVGVVASLDASTEYSDNMLKMALAKSFNLALKRCFKL